MCAPGTATALPGRGQFQGPIRVQSSAPHSGPWRSESAERFSGSAPTPLGVTDTDGDGGEADGDGSANAGDCRLVAGWHGRFYEDFTVGDVYPVSTGRGPATVRAA